MLRDENGNDDSVLKINRLYENRNFRQYDYTQNQMEALVMLQTHSSTLTMDIYGTCYLLSITITEYVLFVLGDSSMVTGHNRDLLGRGSGFCCRRIYLWDVVSYLSLLLMDRSECPGDEALIALLLDNDMILYHRLFSLKLLDLKHISGSQDDYLCPIQGL